MIGKWGMGWDFCSKSMGEEQADTDRAICCRATHLRHDVTDRSSLVKHAANRGGACSKQG